jgi:hypothetical protein
MQFHSYIAVESIQPEVMRNKMADYLGFLQRKFVSTLSSGEKIFVIHHGSFFTIAQVLPFLAALRAWGPNTLLWVTPRSGQDGAIDQLGAHLYRGHVDVRMEDPGTTNKLTWLSLCANVFRLWREQCL